MCFLKHLLFGISSKSWAVEKCSEVSFTFRNWGDEFRATMTLTEKEKSNLLSQSLAKFEMTKSDKKAKKYVLN